MQALRAGDALFVRLVAAGKAGRTAWREATADATLWVTPLDAQGARVELVDAGRVLSTVRMDAKDAR